jgi:hypothetical protein
MREQIQIVSLAKRQAKVTLLLPGAFVASRFCAGTQEMRAANPMIQGTGAVAQPATFDEVEPDEGDYIYPVFRALSATLIPGYWLDYGTPGMLEQSARLLEGQTVYKNHSFRDVEQWIGVVNSASWDAEGTKTQGVPGINVELKIDWRMNPRIARGLLMEPPAIHSVSVTVLFEYEYSHPQLMEEGRFWNLLGDEVDGEIVRLVVTKILGYWEISLVFQGADQFAKRIEGAQPQMAETESLQEQPAGAGDTRSLSVMNLPQDLRNTLGLSEQVTNEALVIAIQRLIKAAAAGDAMLETGRAETLRLARLAEGGAEGELGAPIADLIRAANPVQLSALKTMYEERMGKRFPHTCQACGNKSTTTRSSVESPLEPGLQPPENSAANMLH